jgi:hypothetical protein
MVGTHDHNYVKKCLYVHSFVYISILYHHTISFGPPLSFLGNKMLLWTCWQSKGNTGKCYLVSRCFHGTFPNISTPSRTAVIIHSSNWVILFYFIPNISRCRICETLGNEFCMFPPCAISGNTTPASISRRFQCTNLGYFRFPVFPWSISHSVNFPVLTISISRSFPVCATWKHREMGGIQGN